MALPITHWEGHRATLMVNSLIEHQVNCSYLPFLATFLPFSWIWLTFSRIFHSTPRAYLLDYSCICFCILSLFFLFLGSWRSLWPLYGLAPLILTPCCTKIRLLVAHSTLAWIVGNPLWLSNFAKIYLITDANPSWLFFVNRTMPIICDNLTKVLPLPSPSSGPKLKKIGVYWRIFLWVTWPSLTILTIIEICWQPWWRGGTPTPTLFIFPLMRS